MVNDIKRLHEFEWATATWADRTFKKSTYDSITEHLYREAGEYAEAMKSGLSKEECLAELADCLCLLCHAAFKTGLRLSACCISYPRKRYVENGLDWVALLNLNLCTRAREIQKHRSMGVYAEEIAEERNPYDVSESFAFYFWTLQYHAEQLGGDLIDAAWKKFEINKTRKWGEPDAQGVQEHVDEDKPSEKPRKKPMSNSRLKDMPPRRQQDVHYERE
jgi:NTP pyrophosphatase (non-canonical NTP hydrolase)